MGQALPVLAPLKGLNTLDPFIAFDSGYARELTNYSVENGRLKVRPAVGLRTAELASANRYIWYGKDPGTFVERGILSNGDVVDMTTGAVSSNVGAGSNGTTRVRHISLDLVIGVNTPRLATPPFTAWGFTTLSGMTASAINSACSHRGRLYVSDGTNIQYSIVGAIAGTMAGIYTISAFMQGQAVDRIFSVTVQPGNGANNVFVAFGVSGKVLVFSGEYPGSSDWQIIGNYDMPAPFYQLGYVEIDGDIFIGTDKFAYWFNDLFAGGVQAAYKNRPSAPIDNLWTSVLWNFGGSTNPERANVAYDPQLDAILCQCFEYSTYGLGQIANYQNESVIMAYFRKYDAWSLWFTTPHFWPKVLIGDQLVATQYGPSTVVFSPTLMSDVYYDSGAVAYLPVETSWKTPYFFPSSGKNRNLNGVKPFFKNSISGYLALIQAIYDFTDYNAPFGFYTQSMVTQIPPGVSTNGSIDVASQTYATYTESCGISGNGAGFSLQFTQKPKSGSSTTQTQEIYTCSVNLDEGAPYPA